MFTRDIALKNGGLVNIVCVLPSLAASDNRLEADLDFPGMPEENEIFERNEFPEREW